MPRRCHTTVAKPSPTSVVSSRCHLPICRLQPHPLVRTRVSTLCRCYRRPISRHQLASLAAAIATVVATSSSLPLPTGA
ncbi:hypothetical protein BHE74_00023902 [Ensete ventricosum]|nr:hypothetical protein BHE74_00023902 [Ensete ventricosum]